MAEREMQSDGIMSLIHYTDNTQFMLHERCLMSQWC